VYVYVYQVIAEERISFNNNILLSLIYCSLRYSYKRELTYKYYMSESSDISIKKILLPIDGSSVSSKATRYAVHLAKMESAELTVLHVIEDIKQGGAIGLQEKYGKLSIVEAFKRAKEQSAQKWINSVEDIANRNGVKVKGDIVDAKGTNEARSIVKYIEDNDFDLTVMGSTGRSRIERLFLGSVTNAVVNSTKRPVLVVH
jgi:nucleotide-binding universal stress UspA family protein